ncbi:hypothetical protein HYV88_01430 [Candidatus Woesearchaeota archaeon]|nr:hypothetical protein [Candidatus Woesearchaeota archaeon]
MRRSSRYVIGTGIFSILALGAVDIKAEKDNKPREEKVWPGALACNEGLQWGLLCNLTPRLDEAENDITNLYATQRAQGEDINDLEDSLTRTPEPPRPTPDKTPTKTPIPPIHHTPHPTTPATPTKPYEIPSPTPPQYATPRPTEIPTQPATSMPDNLSRLIEYARNLPRAMDLPPQENVQDRDEGLYLRAFKVFEDNGRFRHEEISDLTEVDSSSLENHRIRSGTRNYWTVITAGKTFNSDIDMYDEPGVLVNPQSLETVLILRPDTNINTGLFSVHASGLRSDGTRVSYAEMIRAVADPSN